MGWYSREGTVTVVGEVPVDLPGVTKVVGPLDQHGCWSEGLEVDDYVGEVEFRLQVEGYGHVLHAVLRLPPGLRSGTTVTKIKPNCQFIRLRGFCG